MNLIVLALSLSFSWHVMIDPGHGGRDTGASYYGAKEADITLSVSNRLLKKFKATKGIDN